MSWTGIHKLRGTLAFRLTLWYAGIFSLSTVSAFVAFYLVIASVLQERKHEDLIDDVGEFSILLAQEGIDRVEDEMRWEVASDGAEHIFLRLLALDGRVRLSTDMATWQNLDPDPDALARLRRGTPVVLTRRRLPDHEYPIRMIYGRIGPDTVLQIGESMQEDLEFLEIMREVFVPFLGGMVIIATLAGWFMARRALAGVERVTEAALQIAKGDLDRRVVVDARGDEIERLATTFNHMLDRIRLLIDEMKEMNDNIAHDLRTPLARIRGVAEMALTGNPSGDEQKQLYASMIEECDRLLGIVNTMLEIAEAESGVADLDVEPVDMVRLVQSAVDLFAAIAEDKSIHLTAVLPSECVVQGESRKLQRLLANLLDNALKYTPYEGAVTVSLVAQNGQVVLSVQDTGIGISPRDLPYVFNRFYRCDRSRGQDGTGLGLSLVKAIVRAHGGQVTVASQPDTGSVFTVTFPRPSRA